MEDIETLSKLAGDDDLGLDSAESMDEYQEKMKLLMAEFRKNSTPGMQVPSVVYLLAFIVIFGTFGNS